MYTYIIVGGGGGALPASPLPLNTCSPTQLQGDLCTPLTHNNTQEHPTTDNNTQQQYTTTVYNSTRIHKITNVPLFKKLWDIIFLCGTKTS
jgi:hypothetical protein